MRTVAVVEGAELVVEGAELVVVGVASLLVCRPRNSWMLS